MFKRSMGVNSLVLGIFALITALLLAGTHLGTRDSIEQSERAAAAKALLEIIPPERHSNDLLTDTLPIPEQYWVGLGLKNGGDIYLARDDAGAVIAVIVPTVAPDGYSGDIHLITGVNMDGSVAGARALSHAETPGLGDKIDLNKSDWMLDFNGKSIGAPASEQWAVRKDGGAFDQFTGATITPRAVVKQVRTVLEYFAQDRKRIIQASARPATSETPQHD